MSSREWRERVQDILAAIREAQMFTIGFSLDQFLDDIKTIRAVEMNFIIIGEAAAQVPDEIEDANPDIPWQIMRSMRNRLVHVYFSVDPEIMWDTLYADLPKLVVQLEGLIGAID